MDDADRMAKVDERIYALLTMVEDQQTAVRAGLQGLAQERAALATERVALVQQAEKMERLSDKLSSTILQTLPQVAIAASQAAGGAVKAELAGTAMTAVQAAEAAAKPTLDGVRAAASTAAALQLELRKAVDEFRREWKWSIALAITGMILAAALITGGALWLETERIDELLSRKARLTTEVDALQEHVEQARRNTAKKPSK